MKRTLWQHITRRLRSFKYAFKGLFYVVKTQTNMQIHLVIMMIVIFAGFYFKIDTVDWLFLILAIALVLVAEIVNTSIEEIVNFISPEYDAKAGLIKDLGAAFVLLAAIFAVVVGLIIFLPNIFQIIKNVM